MPFGVPSILSLWRDAFLHGQNPQQTSHGELVGNSFSQPVSLGRYRGGFPQYCRATVAVILATGPLHNFTSSLSVSEK